MKRPRKISQRASRGVQLLLAKYRTNALGDLREREISSVLDGLRARDLEATSSIDSSRATIISHTSKAGNSHISVDGELVDSGSPVRGRLRRLVCLVVLHVFYSITLGDSWIHTAAIIIQEGRPSQHASCACDSAPSELASQQSSCSCHSLH